MYEAEVVLDIIESILSNEFGEEMEHGSENGSVSISGEELPVAPESPTGLTATPGEEVVELSWNASANTDTYYVYREQQSNGGTTGCGTTGGGTTGGGTTGGGTDGVGQACDFNGTTGIYDCQLQCVDEATATSWIGDGFCDDNTWGMYLDCPEFDCDGGDCPELACDGGAGGGTTGGGTTYWWW